MEIVKPVQSFKAWLDDYDCEILNSTADFIQDLINKIDEKGCSNIVLYLEDDINDQTNEITLDDLEELIAGLRRLTRMTNIY